MKLLLKKPVFILSLLLITNIAVAQSKKSYEIGTGYGFFEAFNIAIKKNVGNYQNLIGLSIGSGFNLFPRSTNYYSAEVEYDRSILRKKLNSNGNYKWYLNNKITYWYSEDKFYRWDIISLSFSLDRNFYLSNRTYLSFECGPTFNIVLNSKRKSWEKVGWPYHVLPNFRIMLNYNIGNSNIFRRM